MLATRLGVHTITVRSVVDCVEKLLRDYECDCQQLQSREAHVEQAERERNLGPLRGASATRASHQEEGAAVPVTEEPNSLAIGLSEAQAGLNEDIPITPVAEENKPGTLVARQEDGPHGLAGPSSNIPMKPINEETEQVLPVAGQGTSLRCPIPDLPMTPLNQGKQR